MTIQEQYVELQRIKRKVNDKLGKNDFHTIKSLMKQLDEEDAFVKLKRKDTQLGMLDTFFAIWLQEKTKLSAEGISSDIFQGVDHLEILEKKYLTIEFAILRMEIGMPDEMLVDAVNMLRETGASGIAFFQILILETQKREKNILCLAKYLKQYGQQRTAWELLNEGSNAYPENDEIRLQLADSCLEMGKLTDAYHNLKAIKQNSTEIMELICELEKIIVDEKL